jgi:hypothetical protein
VFVRFTGPKGNGFVGIEVKYHENLICKPEEPGKRRPEIAGAMKCFRADVTSGPKEPPLQQIWRDHLLAGVLKDVQKFDDGLFLILYPEQNPHCREAVARYRECLSDDRSFQSLTLEQLVREIRRHTSGPWVERFFDRYLDFTKIDAALKGDPEPRKSKVGSMRA